MIISIIGCSDSAKDWFNTPCDLSIGVNDCAKFGRDPDWLLLVNRRFTPEREKIIKATKAKRVLTSIKHWKDHFKNAEEIRMQPFGKHMKKGHVYSSKTSPFIAMSLAFNAGATDIILFGVDLKTHPVVKDKLLNYELRQWELFCRKLKEYKVNVWVSSGESALSKFLPVWETCVKPVKFNFCLNTEPVSLSCDEMKNIWSGFKLEPQGESEDRKWLHRTIEEHSIEVEGRMKREYDMGEVEVTKIDDEEIVLSGVQIDFTATIDMTQAGALEKFGDLKIGQRFKAIGTHE